jgi:hypothetical protein
MGGNVSGDSPNGTEWAVVFASFHARHRDKDGRKLKFTAVFNAAMDAFIGASEIPLEWRVLAWIWRYSWGNDSDWCVDKIGGEAIGQQACADFFGVDKQRVNDAVMVLRTLNFVAPKTGHKLVPVDDPSQYESPVPNGLSDDESPAPSGLFESFCQQWKSAHQADFRELQSAEETVSRIKKIRLGEYREWRRARTSAGASSYITPKQQQTVESRSVGSLEEDRPTDPPRSPDELLKLPAMVMLRKKLKDTPRPKLRAEILELLQGAPLIDLEARILLRWKDIKSIGMVRDLAQDVGTNFAEFEALRKSDERAYQERSEQLYAENVERVRKEWDSYTEEEREWYRKNLPEVAGAAHG